LVSITASRLTEILVHSVGASLAWSPPTTKLDATTGCLRNCALLSFFLLDGCLLP
jgi:hypothetical protein